jgi:hypothetical protein
MFLRRRRHQSVEVLESPGCRSCLARRPYGVCLKPFGIASASDVCSCLLDAKAGRVDGITKGSSRKGVEARGQQTGSTLWRREAPAGRVSRCGSGRKAVPDLREELAAP